LIDLFVAFLEKLLKAKDITNEKKTEIERLLPQVNFLNEKKTIQKNILFLNKIDNMKAAEMQKIIEQYNMKSPVTNNDLSEPVAFNLMFATSIGPTGHLKGLVISLIVLKIKSRHDFIIYLVIFDRKQLKGYLLILNDY